MPPPSETQAFRIAKSLLSEWLRASRLELEPRSSGADWVVRWKGRTLLVGYKRSTDAPAVSAAIARLTSHARVAGKQAVPLLAVPYMGEVGRRLCEAAGVQWLDLSGNASIRVGEAVIQIHGNENRFKRRGRPSSAFSPKAARVARQFLIHADEPMLQKELAERAQLDAGYISKIVHRLQGDGLLLRTSDARLRPTNHSLLLDAWSESYAFDKHRVVRGHTAGRSSDDVLKRIATALKRSKLAHAATGLAGAWLLTKFATFRVTTFYVNDEGLEYLKEEVGFMEEERGANTWLVVPSDEGVFQGSASKHGVMCAHPVQVYLDLLAHPERAQEAAAELRKRLLPGGV
jgi:hypothetical protein